MTQISSIQADVFCERDHFEVENGKITHKPNHREDRGYPQGAYCIVRLTNGFEHAEIMTSKEINIVRDASNDRHSTEWRDQWTKQAKRVVFQQATEWMRTTDEIRNLFGSGALEADLVGS